MLEFSYGHSRWVILTDSYAIKIARSQFFHFLKSVPRLRRKHEGTIKEKVKEKGGLLRFLAREILPGISANRREYRLYKKTRSPLVAPTLFSFLGIVNVQRRGTASTMQDVYRHPFFMILGDEKLRAEILHAKQFCMIGGRTLLVDYGDRRLEVFF